MKEKLPEADLFDIFEFMETDILESEDSSGEFNILSKEDNAVVIAEFAKVLDKVSTGKRILMYKKDPKRDEELVDIVKDDDMLFIIWWRNQLEGEK